MKGDTKLNRDSSALVFLSPSVGGMDHFPTPRFLADLPTYTVISYYAFANIMHQPTKAAALNTMQLWKRVHLTAPDMSKVEYDTRTPALAAAVYEIFSVLVNTTPVLCTPLLLLQPCNIDEANVDICATQDPVSKMNILIVYTRRAVSYGERPRFAAWEYTAPLVTRRLKVGYSKRLGFDVSVEEYAAHINKLCSDLNKCRTDCLALHNNHMVLLSVIAICERLFEVFPLDTPLQCSPSRPSAEDVVACGCWSQVRKIPCAELDACKAGFIAHTLQYLLCYYVIHEPDKSDEQLVMLGFATRVMLHCNPEWTETVFAAVTMLHQLSPRAEWKTEWKAVFARLQACNSNTRLWAHRHIRLKCL